MPTIEGHLTFGLELECVRLTEESKSLIKKRSFTMHYDRSIKGRDGEDLPTTVEAGGGTELVTPVLSLKVSGRQDGKNLMLSFGDSQSVIEDLCACVAEVNKTCGLHIHLGKPANSSLGQSAWEPDRVRTMLAIGLALEDRLFALCPPSRLKNDYCRTIRRCYSNSELVDFHPMGTVVPNKYNNSKRYCWMNTVETRREGRGALGTLEIRMLGSVRRFEYVWAWVQLWCRIGTYVAYLPSSLAMMHCCFSDSLEGDFKRIEQVKNERNSRLVAEPSAPEVTSIPDEPETVERDRQAAVVDSLFERDRQATAAEAESAIAPPSESVPRLRRAPIQAPRRAPRPPRTTAPQFTVPSHTVDDGLPSQTVDDGLPYGG